jgi:hypothetical protein
MNKQKISYALAIAAFLGSAALFPASADNITVAGNGAFGDTQVQANSNNTTSVSQANNTQAANTVQVANNTGNNQAAFNTGGTTTIQTGDANAAVGVSNTAGSNTAQVSGGAQPDQNTTVAANGAFTDNSVQTNSTNNTALQQANTTDFANNVNVTNNTGNNNANFNTGSNVTVQTGDANAQVGISNSAGSNAAWVNGDTSQSGTNVAEVGNGAFSQSNVDENTKSDTSLSQTNNTTVANDVKVNNNTGGTNANFNTGSNVNIQTGDANAFVGVSNMAGQNQAVVDGGSGGQDAVIGIVGNGAFTQNNVAAINDFRTAATQSNLTYVANYISTMNNTGNTNASFDTGGTVNATTGNANAEVTSFNTAGSNQAFVVGGSTFANAAEIAILDNGAFSDNGVHVNQNNKSVVSQDNNTNFVNDIGTSNNTSNNGGGSSRMNNFLNRYSYLFGNTGYGGDTSVQTGDANSFVSLYNLASTNFLTN